jgi:hypothetical protein
LLSYTDVDIIFIEGNYGNKTDLKNNAACKFVETKTLENNLNSASCPATHKH